MNDSLTLDSFPQTSYCQLFLLITMTVLFISKRDPKHILPNVQCAVKKRKLIMGHIYEKYRICRF